MADYLNPIASILEANKFYRYSLRLLCSLLILSSLLLTGCMTTYRKDGPPPFPVDETRVPNAVPKKEKPSRIGNKPYTVKGKQYFVMKSSKNFVQIGTASWYGTLFHNQRTSNGERYDMLGMTAAHKTLPLPTYVQVKNLENGRKIIVKVNDRGPFKPNRIIDLSYVAAKKLQMTGRGTALVEIRAIDPDNYPPRPTNRGSYAAPERHPRKKHYRVNHKVVVINVNTSSHKSVKVKKITSKSAHTKKGIKHVG